MRVSFDFPVSVWSLSSSQGTADRMDVEHVRQANKYTAATSMD